MSEQLSLFTIHPVQVSKPKIDPYWDEITKPTIKPGDWVKLSPDWMRRQASTAGKFAKDYQFKSENDLICKVLWVDPRGTSDISVDRNGYGLFVPAGNFTAVERDDSVKPFNSDLDNNEYRQKGLGNLLNSSPFTEENVRPQATQNSATSRNHPELDTLTSADEHIHPSFTAAQFADEHTHWVQEYYVQRGNKKHRYYRYCWMVGRKKNCIHIGPVTSPIAQARRDDIEEAIAMGKSPAEIKQMLLDLP
ncbi:hypothetical protein [Calothrix sp. NIES-2098]|uniref:hypothetical protein n=1 Tax=Calothrix sp. NIES-2098 TaxID=1954171 RepID=UPI000B6104F5|nr:hypothetical protein NIES2098_34610 [Calothrix sp. NIES-2098]